MPLYLYECRNCQHEFEIQQSMKDESITLCPQCNKHETRRIITKAGIMFKGSGFYVNDKNIAKTTATKPESTKPECKSESKPAAKPESKKVNSSKDSSS